MEFSAGPGLADVIARHGAQYLNVTEAWWDGDWRRRRTSGEALGDVTLQHPELADFVPSALMELRNADDQPARFKADPARIIEFIRLIRPLRTEWHGPDITHFASVCCDLARLYGGLFPCSGSWRHSTRPSAGTARGCTAAVGAITTSSSPMGLLHAERRAHRGRHPGEPLYKARTFPRAADSATWSGIG